MDYSVELSLLSEYPVIAGTDEAGRGPLAGPVYAAAVILPVGLEIEGLNDSKKLSEKKREKLFDIICEKAISYCIASEDVATIESTDILSASQSAMRKAVSGLSVKPSLVLVDGNVARGFNIPAKTLIGGDAISPNVAAASILAKVSRDRYCKELDERYPQYGFLKHKGYGTAQHREALLQYGPCPEHRMSFLGKILKNVE